MHDNGLLRMTRRTFFNGTHIFSCEFGVHGSFFSHINFGCLPLDK